MCARVRVRACARVCVCAFARVRVGAWARGRVCVCASMLKSRASIPGIYLTVLVRIRLLILQDDGTETAPFSVQPGALSTALPEPNML